MTLIKRINAELPEYWEGFFGRDSADSIWFPKANVNVPAVNIVETSEDFEIELAAPGFVKTDFKINLDRNTLSIKAVKNDDADEVKKNYKKREFHYGSFERVFRLPNYVLGDKIEASLENGVLSVLIPKREEAKVKEPKAIEVK